MDPIIKMKWVAALRSGNYVQGKYYLKKYDDAKAVLKYCCLGVLRDVVEPGHEGYKDDQGLLDDMTVFLREEHVCGLTGEQMIELGKQNDGNGAYHGQPGCAKTFEQIAGYIEEKL